MTDFLSDIGRFTFVRLSALRTAQLMRGCRPLVAASSKLTTTARHEIAAGKVRELPRTPEVKPIS